MPGIILSIDQGTTGTTVVLLDQELNIRAHGYREFGQGGTPSGRADDPRPLNEYVGDYYGIFRCPADRGRAANPYSEVKPTVWDVVGMSYLYNAGGNTNGTVGLQGRHLPDVKVPSYIVFASDWGSAAYFAHFDPIRYFYWHHQTELGWGNVLFVDAHVKYLQLARDDPTYQKGPDWSFIYDDSP